MAARLDSSDADRRNVVLTWLRGLTTDPRPRMSEIDPETLQRWSEDYFRSKLPLAGSTTEVPVGPVQAPVRIRRDSWGIAHVSADSEHDLFFGLGYAMAQDRLWQMDYQRRLVRGQLAAVLGQRALASDRMMRTLGMGAAGDRAWETASPEVRDVLTAFTSGINRWIDQAGSRLPIEFEILGYEPAPWHPADSIAIWKHRWWTLTGRLELIVLAEAARRLLPPELADAFFTVELADETIVPTSNASTAATLPGHGGPLDEGSNNWVVGGSHTTTGAPVVCSDPHNPFSAPSQWFEAQLTCPSIDAAGAIYIGTPVLYLGRTRDVAWGLTNHAISVRDLYLEEPSSDHPGMYRDGIAWRPFEVDHQTIAVAGEPDDHLEIRRTVRGPVVNDILPGLDDLEVTAPVTLRWIGAEAPSGFDATLGLLRARSADDVLSALRRWPCPPLNFVYADRSGHIGYHAVGLVPRHGRPGYGLRHANNPDDAWNGFVAFDDLPHEENPVRGWIATANNVPWSRDPDYLASGAWSDGYRARRIRERLTASDRLRPDEIAAIHGDVHSIRARELTPALLEMIGDGESPLARDAVRVLRSWDYEFTTESVGASIWTAFWTQWCLVLARARFPEALVEPATVRVAGIGRRLLLGETVPWLPDGDVPLAVRGAFNAALGALEAWGGADVEAWRWGSLHQVVHPHPMGISDELRALYDTGPYPTSGGSSIVRAAGHGLSVPFTVVSGSTYRFMADLGRPDHLQSTQTLGQSAHLGSPHYRDQTPLWLANDYHPFWMSEGDVLAHLESEVVILPG